MRVLSIDGGGIRGLIPALVLTEIERRSGKRVVGAVRPDRRDVDGRHPRLRAVRARSAARPSSWWRSTRTRAPTSSTAPLWQRIRSADGLLDEKYDAAALDRALERFLVRQAARRDQAGPASCPPTTWASPARTSSRAARRARRARTSRCRRWRAPPRPRRPTSSRSSWAAQALVDGGVFATNPAMCAVAEVHALPAGRRGRAAVARHRPAHAQARASTRSRTGASSSGPGRSSTWCSTGSPTRSTTSSSTSSTTDRYWRLQVELTRASDDLDDASEDNLARAARATRRS